MHKFLAAICLTFVCAMLASAQQTMTNDSVVKLIKAGMSDDIIVSSINNSSGNYDTSVDGLIALKTAGASNKVVATILLKSAGAAAIPAVGDSQQNTSASAVQEPDVMGKVFFLNPGTHALEPLPGEQWKRQMKAGFNTVKTINIIAGEHSSFRVSSKDKIVFIFKPVPDQKDFNAIQGIKLYPFEIKDGKRICIVQEQKGRTHEGNPGVISLQVAKYGASSYTLSPDSHIGSGEYWVLVPGAAGFNDPLVTIGVD